MKRRGLFLAAIAVLYIGGFVYDEVGPVLYALMLAMIASVPLLLKIAFWKKLLFMIPLFLLRVISKVLLKVFGKNALSKLLARYDLLEDRFNKTITNIGLAKDRGLSRWHNMSRPSQAYLLLIFLPVAGLIFLLLLIIKFVRLRFLMFFAENLMQKGLTRWTKGTNSAKKTEK